jgi:xanthine dehydrogenase accessory factor
LGTPKLQSAIANTLVVMRGGGDMATGAAVRLVRAGFPLVITELSQPLTVRRAVALASAVLQGSIEVEGVRAERIDDPAKARELASNGIVPVLVDPDGESIPGLAPEVVVDARMTKNNAGGRRETARFVVALGPGFSAGEDCDAVIETNRGHFLGRVYWKGQAEPDTGTPDPVQGHGRMRVLRATAPGVVRTHAEIGDSVVSDQRVATVGGHPICAPFRGVVRGIIGDGTLVPAGVKIGDIDPRGRREYCFTVSDKSLAVGGGVLEAILSWLNRPNRIERLD